MNKKKLYQVACVMTLSIILAVVSWFILPDTVAIQINLQGGAGNTAPKIMGVLLPLCLSAVFSVLYYVGENKKHFIISILGIVVGIVLVVFNAL